MNPFSQAEYLRCWRDHVAPALAVEAHVGDACVTRTRLGKGVLTLRRLVMAGAENDWAVALTPPRLADFSALAATASWDVARLLCLQDPDPLAALATLAPLANGPHWVSPAPAEYAIRVAGGYEPFLASLGSKVRCEIRRKEKKALALAPVCRRLNGEAEVLSLMQRFFDCHGAQWRARGVRSLFEAPAQRACWQAWLQAPASGLEFWGVFLNETLCSMRIGLRAGDTYFSILTINTGDYADYSPGSLLLQAEIRAQCETGCTTFHLGPGYERYKEQLGAEAYPVSQILLANPRSLRGRAFLAYQRYRACSGRRDCSSV